MKLVRLYPDVFLVFLTKVKTAKDVKVKGRGNSLRRGLGQKELKRTSGFYVHQIDKFVANQSSCPSHSNR